jgi:hypothetical protein
MEKGIPLPPSMLLLERLRASGLLKDQFCRGVCVLRLGMDAFNLGQISPISAVEDDATIPMKQRPHNADVEEK